MFKYINVTPHAVTIIATDGTPLTVHPEPGPPGGHPLVMRCVAVPQLRKRTIVGPRGLIFKINDPPVFVSVAGVPGIERLAPAGTVVLVSGICGEFLKNNPAVLPGLTNVWSPDSGPDEVKRNAEGAIVGSRALIAWRGPT